MKLKRFIIYQIAVFILGIISSSIIPAIININFDLLTEKKIDIYLFMLPMIVLFLTIVNSTMFFYYIKPIWNYAKTGEGNIIIVGKRILKLPFTSAILIVFSNIMRTLMINTIFIFITGIHIAMFVSRLAVIIVSSAIHVILIYATSYFLMHRFMSTLSVRDGLYQGTYSNLSLVKNLVLINIASIVLPVAVMIMTIFLYDKKTPYDIDIGIFILVGISIITTFIGLQMIFIFRMYNRVYEPKPLENLPFQVVEKFNLTKRESEIIILIAQGFTNSEICVKLDISHKTVKNHIYNIYQKVGVTSRVKLINLLQGI